MNRHQLHSRLTKLREERRRIELSEKVGWDSITLHMMVSNAIDTANVTALLAITGEAKTPETAK